jgi:cobalt/nickel transport protein
MKPAVTVLMVLAIVALVAAPFFLHGGSDKKFAGTDDLAKETVKEHHPDYEPWAKPIWEPPSGEVETFLFALQAAGGAGFLGYMIGYYRGRSARTERSDARV